MATDLDKIQSALESEEVQSFIANIERFDLSSLSALTDMVSARADIKLVRGIGWAYDPKEKVLTYDEGMLLQMPPKAAPGLIFHNVGHSLHSVPEKTSIGMFKNKVSKDTGKKISPQDVYDLIEAAEDERMERRMVEEFNNLRNSHLPRSDQGWRKKDWKALKDFLDTPTQPGQMIQHGSRNDGKPIQSSAFYARASTAIRGLVSGALTRKDLPPDMRWSKGLVQEIENLRDIPTVDELLREMERIIKRIIQERENPEPEPEDGEGEGDGEGDQKEGQGNGQKDGKGKGSSKGQGGGNFKPGKGQAEAEAAGDNRGQPDSNNRYGGQGPGAKDDKSFVNNGGGAGFGTDKLDVKWHGPEWSQVLKSCLNITSPIRVAVRRYLKDNENSDKVHGFIRGKLQGSKMVRGYLGQNNNVFSKYEERGNKNYAIYVLIDVSGSMESGGQDIRVYPELEGYISNPGGSWKGLRDNESAWKAIQASRGANGGGMGHLWAFACRMTVAIVEVLRGFKEVEVGIGTYHSNTSSLKMTNQALTPERQQKIMDDIASPRGGTNVQMGLKMAQQELRKSRAEKKLVLVLTDGDFSGSGVAEIIKELKQANTDVAVMTLGVPPDTARHFVPPSHADEVTDENIGPVIGKHIKRMVK